MHGVPAVWTETVFGQGEWKKPFLLAKAMHASTAVQRTGRWVVDELFVQIPEAKGKGTISIAAEQSNDTNLASDGYACLGSCASRLEVRACLTIETNRTDRQSEKSR